MFNDQCLSDSAGFVSDDKWIGKSVWKLRHNSLFKFVNGMELNSVWSFLDLKAAVSNTVDTMLGGGVGWMTVLQTAKRMMNY